MTESKLPGLDVRTIEKLEKAGFIRPSLEPYLEYQAEYRKQLKLADGKIEQALEATAEICNADYSTIRRAVNKVTILLTT